jgi:uncharacterized protein (TIGR01370 family)
MHQRYELKIVVWIWLICFGSAFQAASAEPIKASPAVAFFYGKQPPMSELQAFDLVVVDPDHVPDPQAAGMQYTRLAAYVALGEVQTSRAYAKHIPADWILGENKNWGSRVIDQSRPDWPQFFAESVVTPLWNQGYRTFFLDTLDSYQLVAKTPEARASQEAGMVAVVKGLATRFPGIRLMFNRGFEILPATHTLVEMVVVESLFQGFDAAKRNYREVSSADRDWLLGQIQQVKTAYGLPVVVIDYVPSAQRELARSTAQRIIGLGLIPWVATPDLATLGVGNIEVMPRRIAVVHSVLKDEYALREIAAVRFGAMPLQYLGYLPEYLDIRNLPDFQLRGRYAGVLIWLDAEPVASEQVALQSWLERVLTEQVPIAFMGVPSFVSEGHLGEKFGFSIGQANWSNEPVQIVHKEPMVGYERQPTVHAADFYPLAVQGARVLLGLTRRNDTQSAVALTKWGGYALSSYDVVTMPGESSVRWVINPFGFLKEALRLPEMPVPDVTTESGRRMLMVHMDGDGFISRSELPGNPMAGEVVRDRVVNRYPLPMTMSVIEAELSPNGLYPDTSIYAENVAREIFRAPNVAIASHSYSHPFYWSKAGQVDPNGGYNLRLPGYQFDLNREIDGSIQYINNRLAPSDKAVSLFFWTGDCVPGADALAKTRAAHVLNMNGGDTTATRTAPTMTEVEGLGLQRSTGYQVFAPNQNENVYTNNWLGPFYGYERVIETFEFTESPRRLKPMDIYFHTYLTTKAAGLKSLDKVFAYAMDQETTPVYVADYARKVLDFQDMVIARTATGWRVRGGKDLRTIRMPAGMGTPDIENSSKVAGFTTHQGEVYFLLSGDSVEVVLTKSRSLSAHLVSINGHIEKFEPLPNGGRWHVNGYVSLKFTLANADACQVKVAGRLLKAKRRAGELSFFEIQDHVARPLEAICRG